MAHAQLDVIFAVLWRERFVLPRRHVLVGLLTAPRRQGPPSSRVDPELIVDMTSGHVVSPPRRARTARRRPG